MQSIPDSGRPSQANGPAPDHRDLTHEEARAAFRRARDEAALPVPEPSPEARRRFEVWLKEECPNFVAWLRGQAPTE